jgi:5'-3' exonuclease
MTVKGDFQSHLRGLSRGIISTQEYRGKVVGIDISAATHRFIRRDPAPYLLHQDHTGVVRCMRSFADDLHRAGILPLFVFDGMSAPAKAQEDARRSASRAANLVALLDPACEDRDRRMLKALGQTWELKRAIMEDFRAAGIRYLVAPYEADSQLVWLCKQGICHAVMADDGDLLVMGCPRMVRHCWSLAAGTGAEYSLEGLPAAAESDPLLELAHKHGAEATFAAFAAMVGND